MAKKERVHDCAAPGCTEFAVEGRTDLTGWQEVGVKPLIGVDEMGAGVRPVKMALCPDHRLCDGGAE